MSARTSKAVAQAESLRDRPAHARLLAAAGRLAAERGYASLTVGELSEVAGVSRQTFYTHFSGKRACVAEATEARLGEIEARCASALEDGVTWAGPVLAAVEGVLADAYDSDSSPRARIVAALLDAVGEHGYAATRLTDVLKAAGVSHPTFYRYFDDKETCFAVAREQLVDRLAARVEGREEDASGGTAIQALAVLLAAEPRKARVLLIEGDPSAPGDDSGRPSRSFEALLRRLLAADHPHLGGGGNAVLGFAVGATIEVLRRAALRDTLPDALAEIDGLEALLAEPRTRPREAAHRGRRRGLRKRAPARALGSAG